MRSNLLNLFSNYRFWMKIKSNYLQNHMIHAKFDIHMKYLEI